MTWADAHKDKNLKFGCYTVIVLSMALILYGTNSAFKPNRGVWLSRLIVLRIKCAKKCENQLILHCNFRVMFIILSPHRVDGRWHFNPHSYIILSVNSSLP